MKKLWSKPKRSGFTLVESMVSLWVVAMVCLLVSWMLRLLATSQQSPQALTAFHMYLRMVESPKFRFISVSPSGNQLRLATDEKNYSILLNRGSVRMTTDSGGYLPLLDGVYWAHWDYQDPQVIMANGESFTARSINLNGGG